MKNYYCLKCGSIDIFIDDRGIQKALMCGDCGKWIKWIGNKELPLVKRFIEENKQANKCEWDEIGDVIQDAADRKGMTKKEMVDLGDKIISEVRSSKKKKEIINENIVESKLAIDKKTKRLLLRYNFMKSIEEVLENTKYEDLNKTKEDLIDIIDFMFRTE